MKKEAKWKRVCPKCGKEIPYTRIYERDRAEKRNTNCKLCALKSEETRKKMSESHKGIKQSEETKKKRSESLKGKKREPFTEKTRKRMSESHIGIKPKPFTDEAKKNIKDNHADFSGKNHPMYGKCAYDIWVEKYGKDEADKRGVERSKKQRLSALKRIEKQNGQISPNYNFDACEIIRWFDMYYDFNFRHAENGGEVCIDGYFPDGIDEKRKTIIEIDEKHHFDKDGNLRPKDIQRQKYLEGLGYTFIRVRIE